MGNLSKILKKLAKNLLRPAISFAIRQEYNETEYLIMYPGIAQCGWDAYWHYLKYGKSLGLSGRLPKIDYSRITPERIEKWRQSPKIGIAVCTSLCGDREKLLPPAYINDGWEYICYSDRPRPSYGIWEIRPIPYENDDLRRRSRWAKLHLPELFPRHDHVFWIDSNIIIKENLESLLTVGKNENGWLAIKHPYRDCVYEEAEVCAREGLDSEPLIKAQIHSIQVSGMPRNYGLVENNFFLIEPKAQKIRTIFSQWWEEYAKFSCRDQLSLPYVFYKNDFWPAYFLGTGKDIRNWVNVYYIPHHVTWHIALPDFVERDVF